MSLLSSFFKTKKTPTYSGSTPYSSLMDAAGGKDYYQNIQNRLAGRGVGYGEDYASYANPQMANLRNTFQSYTLPELKSDLTATGRRSGTAGSNALENAYRNQAASENDIMARLAQRNAEVSHEDVNDALQKLGAFNTGDYNAKSTAANFERSTFDTSMQNKQYDDKYNDQKAGQIGGAAVQLAFGGNGGLPTYSPSSFGYNGGLNFQQYGASTPPPAQQDYYKQLLARNVASRGQRGSV